MKSFIHRPTEIPGPKYIPKFIYVHKGFMKLIMKRNLFFTMWLVVIVFFIRLRQYSGSRVTLQKGDKEAALNMAISLLDKDDPGSVRRFVNR